MPCLEIWSVLAVTQQKELHDSTRMNGTARKYLCIDSLQNYLFRALSLLFGYYAPLLFFKATSCCSFCARSQRHAHPSMWTLGQETLLTTCLTLISMLDAGLARNLKVSAMMYATSVQASACWRVDARFIRIKQGSTQQSKYYLVSEWD